MFDSKRKPVVTQKKTVTSVLPQHTESLNTFVQANVMLNSATHSLGNGSLKYTTTGSSFIDQFGKAGNYLTKRSFADVSADMSALWDSNPELALKFTMYLRMITRNTVFNGNATETVQRGTGARSEGIMRMLWVATHHPEQFYQNLPLYVAVGGWRDVFEMLSLDLQYHGWDSRVLDWDAVFQFISYGMTDEAQTHLVRKWMPSIRASSKTKTIEAQSDTQVAKWLANKMFAPAPDTYAQYRKFKSSGTAHQWQQLISQGKFSDINFSNVHGRALTMISNSKFLNKVGIFDKYINWINEQPTAKFTGFPHELMSRPLTDVAVSTTVDKQFYGLVNTARENALTDTRFIAVIDTSGSMGSPAIGTKVSAFTVAKSIALFLSEMLDGAFKNSFFAFTNTAEFRTWVGDTPSEKFKNYRESFNGGTNFISVADKFVKILSTGVPESEFPTGIVCISDGCFNSTGGETATKTFLTKLSQGGFSAEYVKNFKIVLWDIPNTHYGGSQTAFEAFPTDSNVVHIASFDPSVIAFLTGLQAPTNNGTTVKTAQTTQELFDIAMSQEILQFVRI